MKNRVKSFLYSSITPLLLFLSISLYRLVLWVSLNFSGLSMDQIIFHMKVPIKGTDSLIIETAIKYVLITPVLVSSLAVVLLFIVKKSKKIACICIEFMKTTDTFVEIKIPLLSYRILNGLGIITAIVLFTLTINKSDQDFDLFTYINGQINGSMFIEDNYVSSDNKITFPKVKRNLVYIYLESMENTYTSIDLGGAFEDNYIPELVEIADKNISFSNNEKLGGFVSSVGTGWTMAAMFSQSAGLPLILPIDGNSMSERSDFFPGVTTIGDVLNANGYSNHLLIGSDATFGGRRNFYEQHGSYNIFDYSKAIKEKKLPDDYKVWWGYEDRKLFEYAKEMLNELSAEDQPFNLTMLTVDTHSEDGYICEICPNTYDEKYANVIACSSYQVNEFLEWMKEQDFYENTTIVLVGDHKTMDTDFLEDIDKEYRRTIYNVFINSVTRTSETRQRNRNFTAYDLFPSTLSALGATISGDRLGIGTNLFSSKDTLLELYGDEMSGELSKVSSFYSDEFVFSEKNE